MPPVVSVEPEVLKRVPLFRDLDSEALNALAAAATIRRCDAGETIVEQETAAPAVYVILRGRATVSVAAKDGRTLTIREIGQLEIIGEVSLFDGGLPSATVTALSTTELLGVERQSFMALIRDQPRIAVALLPVLAARLRRLTSWADDFAGLRLSARLAKCLLGLLALDGQQLGPARIRIGQKLSQEGLARRLGVTRESVNKHLKRLEREAIVTKENGYLVVVDLVRLQAEAEQE